ncbi:hypothetical protein LTR28_001425 [Elasticomyces elasticus]|nr:hypothetical protein LTR28_001425 [Elasticomyces elasticus]
MHLNPMFEQHINHVENLTVAPEIAQFFHVEDDNRVTCRVDDSGALDEEEECSSSLSGGSNNKVKNGKRATA